MSVSLQCRLCRATLLVPEGLAGKPTNCPQCGERMIVPSSSGAAPVGPPSPSAAPPAGSPPGSRANLYPPGMTPPSAQPVGPASPPPFASPPQSVPQSMPFLPPRAPSLLSGTAATNAPPTGLLPPPPSPLPPSPPTTKVVKVTPVPPATHPTPPTPPPPPPASTQPTAHPTPPKSVPGAPASVPASAPSSFSPPAIAAVPASGVAAPPASPTQKPPAPPPRAIQTARFIAADPTALKVHLGADGKLPALVLHDVDQALEAAVAHPKTSPPWLLLVVFGFSVTMSLAMLFIDSGNSTQVERRSRTAARAALQQNYTGTYPPLAPYQQKIRLALQAHQQGDRAEEKRLFREVLDILHAESKNRSTGVTGMIDAPDPPAGNASDRHLEGLISTLLSDY